MTNEQTLILENIKLYLELNPSQRFGQALFNLGINQFRQSDTAAPETFQLRDIYNDRDTDIVKRMDERLNYFNSQK
ncbi:MAG: hypothetical protein V4580_17355 [Bacteroidota bacterium]